MTHASLFTGIGGFDLAAQWMGWENVFQVEIDKFCQKVLEKNFPNTKRYGDIKQFDGREWAGKIDVLSGGFPCQPFSTAGRRKGKEDDRYLWPEMLRVIREIQPSFIVGENVYGLVNWSGGLVFEEVQTSLENEGYEVTSVILPACSIDAPHRRDRIWIVAFNTELKSNGRHHSGTGEGNGMDMVGNLMDKARWNEGANHIESSGTNGINTNNNNKGLQGSAVNGSVSAVNGSVSAVRQESGKLTTGLFQSEWKDFPTQSPLCGGDDGVSPELDIIRQIDERYSKESVTTANEFKWKVLRAMWEYKEFAEASPNVYSHRIYNSVSIMPRKGAYERWHLGEGCEETKELRGVWSAFYSKSFEEAQDLQRELLEYFAKRASERTMEKRQRVDRIKSLGNAIVPQVAFEIFKAIEQVTI